MEAFSLVGVSKAYARVKALDEVDLAVEKGEFVTILGPSGSGKTSLLNVISGLMPPDRGAVVIGGRDVTSEPPAARNIGLVFQSYALFPNMTVFGNVAFPLEARGLKRAEIIRRVGEALELVRLSGFDDRKPAQLSGGQQQRVALARAIVFKPDILLLDEPLAALDRKLREEVRAELRRMQRSLGVTTILVTHDQEEALSLSDRIVVLESGRVRQIGAPDAVYRRPATFFVADFLGEGNFFRGMLRSGAGGAELVEQDGAAFPCLSPPRLNGEAVALLRPERVRVRGRHEGGLAGEVVDQVYMGQSVRRHVRLESGRDIIAVSHGGENGGGVGEKVSLEWRPEDVWIIPA